jgi:chromosome-anchoring protein RacA
LKNFYLPFKKNDHGHLLYGEHDIEKLIAIKKQLDNGLSMEDVELSMEVEETKAVSETVSSTQYEKRLDEMVEQMNELENKLSQKADEVVSIRLYQHRNELDQLTKTINEVESRIEQIETQLSDILPSQEEKLESADKRKRNWFVSIFGT